MDKLFTLWLLLSLFLLFKLPGMHSRVYLFVENCDLMPYYFCFLKGILFEGRLLFCWFSTFTIPSMQLFVGILFKKQTQICI